MARLEQRGQCQGCCVAILVREQGLHVAVASRNHLRPLLGQEVECADGSEAHHRLGGSQEDLQDRGGVRDVIPEDGVAAGVAVDNRQVAEGPRRLVRDHLTLVAEAVVQVRHQRLFHGWISLSHQHLSGISDQQALCDGALKLALCDFRNLLVKRQSVRLLQLVNQGQRMELDCAVLRVNGLLDFIHPTLHDVWSALHEVDPADEGGRGDKGILVHDCRLKVSVNLGSHCGIEDAAQDANGVGPKAVVLAVHVLDQALDADEHLALGWVQLFDDQVDHAPQAGARRLEELCDVEEQSRELFRRERFTLLEKVQNPGEEVDALLRINGCVTETTRLLEHCCLVLIGPRVREFSLLNLQVLLESGRNLLFDGLLQRLRVHASGQGSLPTLPLGDGRSGAAGTVPIGRA
mmetsp:Transcript_103052/g.291342  ORF Transcript_103052/g.291342 Transcript_103052/m.291342 type:complete len:406 (-) Transcript_103052:23-1240(-)